MSAEERIATTEAEYQKRKAVVDQWWQKQEDVSLDEIAEEMKTYLDKLKDVRTMALDEFGQMLWLSPEHRRQILQGKTRLIARKQELERMLSSLIHAKLVAVVGKERTRMHYKTFDSCITARYGVTIENWPPITFASPPKMNNVPSLVSLYLLWKSGATRFRRLSSEEKKQWDKVREDLMREAAKDSAPVLDNSLKVPPSTPTRYAYSYLQLIDTRTIGTIDQVSTFFNPPLRPTGRKRVKKGYPFV